MNYPIHYDRHTAPKLGLVFNAIGAFSSAGKERAEKQMTALFEQLIAEGAIHEQSTLIQRVFGPHEALAAAEKLARAAVDIVLICNSAFPSGQSFPTIALHPNLSRTPLVITSDFEVDLGDREWTTNAWCGVIMNNYVAKRIGRPARLLAGNPQSAEYKKELRMLLNCARAVAMLRRDVLGRFGDAPGGFHSATIDQMTYLKVFGTRVETVDLVAVMQTYDAGVATGYSGTVKFTEDDVRSTAAEMCNGRSCVVSEDYLLKGARLYHALKAQIEANGFTSVAVKCWPELLDQSIGIAACLPLSLLLAKGDVTAAGCESDCATTVMQTLGTLLSGKPAACLDFVDYTGRCEIVELGHCGVGIPGLMADGEVIDYKSPDRQGGALNAPALVGQFAYGPKTGLAVAPDGGDGLKILCFTGENTSESARNKRYASADVIVKDCSELNHLIITHGFPHHLAVAMGDIRREVEAVCQFVGVEYLAPGLQGKDGDHATRY